MRKRKISINSKLTFKVLWAICARKKIAHNQVVKETKISMGMVSEILNTLHKNGIVRCKKFKNKRGKEYRLNHSKFNRYFKNEIEESQKRFDFLKKVLYENFPK